MNAIISSEKVAVVGGGIAGVGAAWALHRGGYEVELFEKGPALGGNAKTFRWETKDGHAESPLLVIAWPQMYYNNYEQLLSELGVGIETLPIAYFVQTPEGHFCQDGETDIERRFKPQFRRWRRLVSFVSRVNDFFLPKNRRESLYHFSYLNPMNLIPLYWMARLFGISKAFWNTIFVPIHCASFITTSMRGVPAVILPVLENIVPLEKPCRMGTWRGPPRNVFDRMTAPFAERVHTRSEIVRVARSGERFTLQDRAGRQYEADKVLFACDAPAVLESLESPTWLQRFLLGRSEYVDDVDPTFSRFVVHSDENIFPVEHRERIASEFNTYSEVQSDGSIECTFVLSSKYPGLTDKGTPMLVTFNSKKAIDKVQAEIDLPHPTHTVSLRNLMIMSMMRLLQGKGGIYYCGAFTTPEGGHDLSFMSGLVAAHMIGAPYPLPASNADAVADFELMQRMMLGSRGQALRTEQAAATN